MSTEIKNTLFRFVTMRAPELSDEKNQEKRFVKKPSSTVESSFDLAVKNKLDSVKKWDAMRANAITFDAIKSTDELKIMNPKLYDFGIWIARNKNSYNEAELNQKKSVVTVNLNETQIQLLWNNLFYQVVTQKDFFVKESIIQMLVADNLIKNFIANDKKTLDTLLHAKVILPKELFIEKESTSTNPSTGAKIAIIENDLVGALPTQEMEMIQTIAKAEATIERHLQLKKELSVVEKKHKRDYQQAYKIALENHQKIVKPMHDQYAKDLAESKRNWCAVKDPAIPYNPADPCQQPPAILLPNIPPFEFEYDNEIDLYNLQNVLTEESFETLLEVLDIDKSYYLGEKTDGKQTLPHDYNYLDGESFDHLSTAIAEVVIGNEQTIIANTPSQGSTAVSIGGIIIPTTNASVKVPFEYQICPVNLGSRGISFTVSIEVPDSSWQISNLYYTMKRTTGNATNGIYVSSRLNNTIFLNKLLSEPAWSESTVTGFEMVISFSNGAKKKFVINGFNFQACFSGVLNDESVLIPGDTTIPTIENSFIPTGFGVKQIGIADYKKVEQTIQGYVEGEVAHIENIMAREYKEKATRKLRRSENTTSSSRETESEKLSDTTSTSRFEMQSEVNSIIQQDKDFSAQANVSYEPISSTKIFAGANFASHSSKENSNLQAITQAKDITERALERLVSKVKEERIEKIVEEFEENNKHGFDNTKGDKHVVGVYRWIDKVYKNQVVNYGKRLMFEFMIPEPAKLHLLGMAENKALGNTLEKPSDPRKFVDAAGATIKLNLKDYTSINENTAKYWGSTFNVELKPMPSEFLIVGKSYSEAMINANEVFSKSETLEIEEGYKAIETEIFGYGHWDVDYSQYHSYGVTVGNASKFLEEYRASYSFKEIFALNNIEKSLPISYQSANYHTLNLAITVKLQRTPQLLAQWQQEAFKVIIEAYQDALIVYNQALAEENVKASNIKGDNPLFYRQIENTVLKKNCISYIIDQKQTAKRTYGKSFNNGLKTFGTYEVKTTAELDDYTSFVKFIEQAFEWDIMSYNFYPYYWGNRNDWAQLYQYDNNDPLFRSFMQSGMARVIVTVRPGFEEAVSYYMQTGQIWNGGEVPVIEDKLFLSIVDELRQPTGQKEGKAWPTRIPTALTILQADSIGLKVEKALPYDEDLSDYENPSEVPQQTNFQITGSQLNTDGTTKQIMFTYQGMDNNFFKTIGQADAENAFPRKFSCLGQEFIINREAAWNATDSYELVFEKLAGQINLIPGIIAKQFTTPNGDPSGIQFIIDTNVISRFDFTKSLYSGSPESNTDIVNLYITSEAVRFTSPREYLDRILDSNGKAIQENEVNTLLPISRFAV